MTGPYFLPLSFTPIHFFELGIAFAKIWGWGFCEIFSPRDFVGLGSDFVGSIWSWFGFIVARVDEEHFVNVPSSTWMLYVNASSMHCCSINARKLVIWFTNGLFLNCGSAYEDLEDVVTFLDLLGLLLHHLCFAHIYKASSNQYLVMFAFSLLVFLLLHFDYTRDFRTEVLPLCQICRYSVSLLNYFQHSLW